MKLNKEQKEEFCPACLAVPLALAGVGSSAMGANQTDAYKKKKQILLWGGISTVVFSILIIVYYKWYKNCKSCR